MTRTYNRWHCDICHVQISQNWLSRVNHLRKHVRDGLLIERRVVDSRGRSHTTFEPVPMMGEKDDGAYNLGYRA